MQTEIKPIETWNSTERLQALVKPIILKHTGHNNKTCINKEIISQIAVNRVNHFPHRLPALGSEPDSALLTQTQRERGHKEHQSAVYSRQRVWPRRNFQDSTEACVSKSTKLTSFPSMRIFSTVLCHKLVGVKKKGQTVPRQHNRAALCPRLCTHFPSGFHSFPDAEEADNPHCQETQSQIPLQRTDVLNPRGDAQDITSVEDTQVQHRLI